MDMKRLGQLLLCASAFCASLTGCSSPVASETDRQPPKTILLAFDGLDFGLLQQFIAEGRMPHCAQLAAQGSLNPLQTSNPAQSPVSWAVFNTGTNPGKTGVPGFVTRFFPRDQQGQATHGPLPQPMLGFKTEITIEGPDGPRSVPYEINPMQGTNWWSYLDAAGLRLLGLQVASTYPPDDEGPHTRLLSGLGVKDIDGSPGTWSVYTSDPWETARSTNTAGKIRKLSFDLEDGRRAEGELIGPRNWIVERHWKERLAAVKAELDQVGDDPRLVTKLKSMKATNSAWRQQPNAVVRFTVDADRTAGQVLLKVRGHSITLNNGDWSPLLPVDFDLGQDTIVHALARFHLLRCDADDVRLLVTPLQFDPGQPPILPPISAPPSLAATISAEVGEPFETLGWAAMTNPLKDRADSGFEAQSFMDNIALLMDQREKLLEWSLAHNDEWDVYYQVFAGTDRVAHMLYREFDQLHPTHDESYAATAVHAWGKTFPLSDAIPAVYTQADRIVGGVLDRVNAGEFGEDCLLMVLSDHGFSSFRRQVSLNNLLIEKGWMTVREDNQDQPGSRQLLRFVDWENTRAYSLSLGKIFINLRGREPDGIVDPEDYLDVVRELQDDFATVTDGPDGPLAITSIHHRDELFHGPWVRESSELSRKVAGNLQPLEHWDGFADLFVGFAPGYRIAWSNTIGGLSDEAFSDNTNHWSGGHCSVDPQHVPGVLISNGQISDTPSPRLIDMGPTLLQRYGLDPTHTDMDGQPLTIAPPL
ncbi:MAG: putative AlkP superfamily phosphohydrolase/phosphomutase [Pseudohongiellaceae bacterium]|jgi:predicted AlkP superfamily phosphohydrolase/phosphomutase